MTRTRPPQDPRLPRTTTIASWTRDLPPHLAAVVDHLADHLLTDETMQTTTDELLPLAGLVELHLIAQNAIAAETTALRQQPTPWRWNDIAATLGLNISTARARYQHADDHPLAQLEDRLDDDLRTLAAHAALADADGQRLMANFLELIEDHLAAVRQLAETSHPAPATISELNEGQP